MLPPPADRGERSAGGHSTSEVGATGDGGVASCSGSDLEAFASPALPPSLPPAAGVADLMSRARAQVSSVGRATDSPLADGSVGAGAGAGAASSGGVRDKAFFAELKRAKEEEARRVAAERVAAMNPEERAEHDRCRSWCEC